MGAVSDAWSWLTTAANWDGGDGVLHRLAEHLTYTFVSLAICCAIALPIALWLGHVGRGGALAINIANVGRAFPTFAVLVLLILTPLGRSENLPIYIALVLFGIPPLLTNGYVGMREVDREVVEAARGMGMTGSQLLFRVELPLAVPLLMTGVRTAAVQIVATATLAAVPGGGGLGRIITAGFSLRDTPEVVAGAVLVAVLALLIEALFATAQRLLDPGRGARRAAARARRSMSAGEPATVAG